MDGRLGCCESFQTRAVGGLAFGSDLFLASLERHFGRFAFGIEGRLAFGFLIDPPSFAFDQLGDDAFMVFLDQRDRREGGLDLFGRRVSVQNPHEDFVDQGRIIGDRFNEFSDRVIGVCDGTTEGRTADERHDRTESQFVGAFAFAGAFSRWSTQVIEESIRETCIGIGQGRCAGSGGQTGDLRDRTGDLVDRIEEDFGGQSSGQCVGVVPIVVGVVLVGLDRELIDIGFADRSDDMSDIEIVFDEILFEVC